MDKHIHPLAVDYLPPFVTAPGETAILFDVMSAILLAMVLASGQFWTTLELTGH